MASSEEAPDLFLYSLSEFAPLIEWLINRNSVRTIVEIGAEFGQLTQTLLDRLSSGHLDQLYVIDPAPKAALESLVEGNPDNGLQLLRTTSLEALKEIPSADCYLIDGDHNYHTVFNELLSIDKALAPGGRFPLVLLHDVGWPCARRDMYYAPNTLPANSCHPHSSELGTVPGSKELVLGGFRSNGQFSFACSSGGARNGVLTAVEDFLAIHPELTLKIVPAILGLGILLPADDAVFNSPEFLSFMDELLARIEENRIDLYLRVLTLQDQLAAEQERVRDLKNNPLRNLLHALWERLCKIAKL